MPEQTDPGFTETEQRNIRLGKTRNADQKTVDWQFTTADARGKLKSLYPKI
jgi:hypothetical protein